MTAVVPGLVSVTFRHLSPAEIVEIVGRTGFSLVEWGGDVHVPLGDVAAADNVATLSRRAGLTVATYGSYVDFAGETRVDDAINTARALGAARLRVWAGRTGSADVSHGVRRTLRDALGNAADRAANHGMNVVLEYHNRTLTDTLSSTLDLLRDVQHPALRTSWQPSPRKDAATNEAELRALLPWLAGLHVFHWGPGGYNDRRSLREILPELSRWCRIATDAENPPGGIIPTMIEFVRGDDPGQFAEDASALTDAVAASR
jgi:3-dehydroshikimate dehydratase